MQPKRHIRVFRRVGPSFVQGDLIEGELLGSLPRDVLEMNGAMAEVLERERIHVVAGRRAVEHVGFQHRIETHSLELDTAAGKNAHVVFEILPDLYVPRILQQRSQCVQKILSRNLLRSAVVIMAAGNVGSLAWFDGKRHANQVGPHVIKTRGLGIEGKTLGITQSLNPRGELFRLQDNLVIHLRLLFRRHLIAGKNLRQPGLELEVGIQIT